jgi:molybdate transport system regulatory protein
MGSREATLVRLWFTRRSPLTGRDWQSRGTLYATHTDERTGMKLSTRNQLSGTVTAVTTGEAMAVVKIRLDGGAEITSSITKEASDDLGLVPGSKVIALIKSTEVALAVD